MYKLTSECDFEQQIFRKILKLFVGWDCMKFAKYLLRDALISGLRKNLQLCPFTHLTVLHLCSQKYAQDLKFCVRHQPELLSNWLSFCVFVYVYKKHLYSDVQSYTWKTLSAYKWRVFQLFGVPPEFTYQIWVNNACQIEQLVGIITMFSKCS